MSAISYVHKLLNLTDPTKEFLVLQLLEGVGTLRPPKDNRAPITREDLSSMLIALPTTGLCCYQAALFKAMFLFAWSAFARLSEFTSTQRTAAHNIPRSAFSFHKHCDRTNVQITFHSYKHSTPGQPHVLIVEQASQEELCLVRALQRYIAVRPRCDTVPMFVLSDGGPVPARFFSSILARTALSAGLQSTRISSHSFRIGAACHAVSQGMSYLQISSLGRWRSPSALQTYLRSVPSWRPT